MSRAGRPSARGAHKRNLIGPREILRRIEASGGVPEEVMDELRRPRATNPRSKAANEAALRAVEGASALLSSRGIEHERDGERREPDDPDPHTAMARESAWIMSVMNAMSESVPRKKWCRHMKAADPHITEIRTACNLGAGYWLCVECGKQADPKVLNANPWPDECDLCGSTMEAGHFNRTMFNIPGCVVQCTVCDDCRDFMKTRKAA